MMTRIRIMEADISASLRQYDAPMVLGIISDKTKMRRVRTAETIPKLASPKIFYGFGADTGSSDGMCDRIERENRRYRFVDICLIFL